MAELREALERQRQVADGKEESLKQVRNRECRRWLVKDMLLMYFVRESSITGPCCTVQPICCSNTHEASSTTNVYVAFSCLTTSCCHATMTSVIFVSATGSVVLLGCAGAGLLLLLNPS